MNKNIFLKAGISSVLFLGLLEKATPNGNSLLSNQAAVSDAIANSSSEGGMPMTAIYVLVALILLYLLIKFIKRGSASASQPDAMAVNTSEQNMEVSAEKVTKNDDSGETHAAIGLAMHEYLNDSHDIESTVLTILRVTKSYSPWSSKIYGLRQTPHR